MNLYLLGIYSYKFTVHVEVSNIQYCIVQNTYNSRSNTEPHPTIELVSEERNYLCPKTKVFCEQNKAIESLSDF
jgi:hypothetical protein